MPSASSLLRVGVVVLGLVAVINGPGAAQAPRPRFHYAAKVVCGPWRDSIGLVRQEYATTINVHNPTDSLAIFRKTLIVTVPPGSQRPVGPSRVFAVDSLRPGFALATDCQDLRRRFGTPPAFEGFVILDSFQSLNVVGVYTVPGGIDVVTVPERVR